MVVLIVNITSVGLRKNYKDQISEPRSLAKDNCLFLFISNTIIDMVTNICASRKSKMIILVVYMRSHS